MAKQVDIVALRKRKKHLQRIWKLLALLAAAGIGLVLYIRRDKWIPGLEGIGTRYQNVTQNDGQDGTGHFPLTVSGGLDYYAQFVNNRLFLLCDKYLYVYGSDGSIKDTRQHGYSNPIMQTGHSRCLVYSCGGTSFRVDTSSRMLYENSVEAAILFASMAEDGSVAVVTESDTFACRLCVYDVTGKLIYTRECVDRLVDVCPIENGCITASVGAENGEIVTVLKAFNFDGEQELWSTSPLPTLCWRVYALSDGGAFVVGDSKCAYYSSTGALLSTYDFTGTLMDCAFSADRAAVLLKNESRRRSQLLLFADRNAAPVTVNFGEMGKCVVLNDEKAYVLGQDVINGYAFSGECMSETKVEEPCEKILKNGKYFYLLGYDTIDRMQP